MSTVFDERVEFAVENLWVKPNIENGDKAKKMLEEAANEGDGDACFFLARCYLGICFVDSRFGFEEDEDKGMRWLEKGLELGSAVTMFGAMRLKGFKPKRGSFIYPPYQSLREIWDEVEKKAVEGQIFCKYMIANAYYYGDVLRFLDIDFERDKTADPRKVVRDFQYKAIGLYDEIIAGGSVLGIGNYIDIITSGDYGIPKDGAKAMNLRHIGAERGVAGYERLEGIEYLEAGSLDKAVEMFERAVEHNDAGACYQLGALYTYNGKLPMNLRKAVEYFSKGIELDDESVGCYNRLGEIYFYGGQDITPDYGRAVGLFLKVRSNNNWSSDMLGTCYLKGWGVEKDYDAARREFEINTNRRLAALGLGEIYAYGLGVKKNIKKAMEYWNRFPDDPVSIEFKSHFKKKFLGLFGWSEV